MTLKSNQVTLELGKLYRLERSFESGYTKEDTLSLWVKDGSVDIKASNSNTTPTALTDMTLNAKDTAVTGVSAFDIIPNYIAIVQNTGTTTEITATGLQVEDLGAIS